MPSNFNSLSTEDTANFSEATLVTSPSGNLIDTSGSLWRLADDGIILWDCFLNANEHVFQATRSYLRHLIQNNSLNYARGQFKVLRTIAVPPLITHLNEMVEHSGHIERGFFEQFKDVIRKTVSEENLSYYTGAFVRWYIWATDAGFSVFDPDVATEFEYLRIGGNPLGQAVLSRDTQRGPLHEVEMTQLRSKLKAAQSKGLIDLADLTLTWLMIAFGTNPKNLTLLEERDYIRTELEDGQVIHELRIPRIKKRTVGERGQFRTRRMVPAIGELVDKLIKQNQTRPHHKGTIRPIFRYTNPRPSLLGTAFESKAFRVTPGWVLRRLKNVVDRLQLTDVNGSGLHLHPRRLRYSFATRLIQEGASTQDVADALDHSSTQFVLVYFNARSDAVRNLDRALSARLSPVAQAFLGEVILNESEATRGNDPRSRISHINTITRSRENVGNCGDYGSCDLLAPLACYTCPNFQAWVDGPHERLLDMLHERREQNLLEGSDPKWTQMHDETILALTLLIQRCDSIKKQEVTE